jgi:hypothetical protein
MISLLKCAMCGKVITLVELKQPDVYNECFCKACDTWLNDFVLLYKKVVA